VTTVHAPPAVLRAPHVIGGAEVWPSGATFESLDPHDGSVVAVAPRGTIDDAKAAIASARRAFDEGPWPRMEPEERRRLLHALADKIDEHADALGLLEARDTGRLLKATRHHDLPRTTCASSRTTRRSPATSPTPRTAGSPTCCTRRPGWSSPSARGTPR